MKLIRKNFKRIWTIIRLTRATDSIQNKLRQILNKLQCIGLGKSPKPNWAKLGQDKIKMGQARPWQNENRPSWAKPSWFNKSLLLSNFGSELSKKQVKNQVKQYNFRVKRENHVSRDFSLVFHEFLTQNMDSICDFSTLTYKPTKF